MLNSSFDGFGASPPDFYPAELRDMIDAFNARIYATVNNGVYKAGFATTQAAYEEAVRPLFSTLDMLEDRLATHRYLCGERLTEADWRLFTTLVRFNAVYVGHFKCNLRRIVDYPNLRGLHPRALSVSWRRRDDQFHAYQATLLSEPRVDQSDSYRAGRA